MENNNSQLLHYCTYHKMKLGLKLIPYINDAMIQHYPAIYIGSGVDIEFPLILLARKIIMVDPCFQKESNINLIFQKVHQFSANIPIVKKISTFHTQISFLFDFGFGNESVSVELFAQDYETYKHILPVGYIIEFNSRLDHTLYKADLLAKLVVGGLIINNHESPLRQNNISLTDIIRFGRDKNRLEEGKAGKLGLKTIRIENVPFAIYQKVTDSAKLLQISPY